MAKGDRFVVLTMDKQTGNAGGLSAHIDRVVYDASVDRMVTFRPKSVRDDSRTYLNRECIAIASKVGRTQAIWNRLKEEGFSREATDKKEKKEKGKSAKKTRKVKSDAVIALCFICSSDEDTMKQFEADGKLDAWIDATLDWFKKEFGEKNVVSAVLTMDETTPHLHVTVVPITHEPPKPRKEKPKFDENGNPIRQYETDKNGNIILDEKGRAVVKKRTYKKQEVTARLSAKDLCHPQAMKRWQTDYAKAMAPFGLRRGIEGSTLNRVPPAEWILQQINGQLIAVEKKVEELEANKKANSEIIQNQVNTITNNATTIGQQETTITANDATIDTQSNTITMNNKVLEQQETAKRENASAIEEGNLQRRRLEQSTNDINRKVEQAKADLEKWGAVLIDEKTLEYPSLTEIEFDDGRTFQQLFTKAINDIVSTINAPLNVIYVTQKQWRGQKTKAVKDIVSNLENELFGANGIDNAYKKAITAFGKELYREAKAVIAHTIKENEQLKKRIVELESENTVLDGDYKLVKKRNSELSAKITQMTTESENYKQSWEREKLARHEDGSPVVWSSSKRQLTNVEYQRYLLEQFEKKKKELEDEKLARTKERDERRKAEVAHKRHMKEIKEMILAMFSLNFKKVVKIIIDHWKAEMKEFARDIMEELKSAIFGAEPTIEGRKLYVSDAFTWARVFAELDEDESWTVDLTKLEPLREDAMRIADGTWVSYRAELAHKEKRAQLFASAVTTLVEMGNNSYQRHLNQEQADTIEAFILFDGGDRKQLCDEIWNEAITSIRSGWRNGTYEALEELRTGELYGQSYSNGLSV